MTTVSTRAGARGLAIRVYAYAFLGEFVLFYPLYALLFAATLSTAQISSLFVIWSATNIVLQLPAGALADLVSRRLLLTVAPLLTGAGFALWTFTPSYLAFAAGFVLWGTASALQDGAWEALVYEELDRLGQSGRYAAIMGRARALNSVAIMAATAIAAPVMAAGGFLAIGVGSVITCLLAAAVAGSFPEHRRRRPTAPAGGNLRSYAATIREGAGQVRAARPVRNAALLLIAVSVLPGVLDEYLPLLADATGVTAPAIPLLLLLVAAGAAVGSLLGGVGARLPTRALAGLLAGSAGAIGVGALTGHPAGFLLLAVGFGGFQLATVAADARLQHAITGPARATVTSLAGLAQELLTIGLFAGYALAATGGGHPASFAEFALPYLVLALLIMSKSADTPGE